MKARWIRRLGVLALLAGAVLPQTITCYPSGGEYVIDPGLGGYYSEEYYEEHYEEGCCDHGWGFDWWFGDWP